MAKVNHKYFPNVVFPTYITVILVYVTICYGASLHEDPYSIAIVGDMPSGVPPLGLPKFGFMADLAVPALSVSLISFILNMAVIKHFASKYNYKERVGKQVTAMGLANLAGSFTSCYPACASLTRAGVLDVSNPATTLHSIISAILVMISMLCMTSVFKYIPNAVLGGIVLTTLPPLMDFKTPLHLWNVDKRDCFVWMVAFFSTLFGGITAGIVVSVGLSLMLLLLDTARPGFRILGRVPGTSLYRDTKRYRNLEQVPNVLVVTFGASLNFSNKDFFERSVLLKTLNFGGWSQDGTFAAKSVPTPLYSIRDSETCPDRLTFNTGQENSMHAYQEGGVIPSQLDLLNVTSHQSDSTGFFYMVVDCAAITELDSSAAKMLMTMIKRLYGEQWRVLFANLQYNFRQGLKRYGVEDILQECEGGIVPTVDLALDHIQQEQPRTETEGKHLYVQMASPDP